MKRSNLMSNAIKFTQSGPITLTTKLLHVTPESAINNQHSTSGDTDVTKVNYGNTDRDIEKAIGGMSDLNPEQKLEPWVANQEKVRKVVIRVEIQDGGPGLKKEDLIE
jgi:signal transduction histidine kinase